ncbi:MAG: hypothetical protein KatS3mg082_0557 [Nitrospiraceae bacterium]|nr:MAG: hypothetical protein KatS3mg082_0557 [Nitrospiraceae bacterium]
MSEKQLLHEMTGNARSRRFCFEPYLQLFEEARW